MEKNIPTYKIKVNPDDASGVFAIALVDQPAIEVDFFKLAKEFEVEFLAKKDKQLLYGPLLIPNKLIFRRDEKTGQEFNIVFDEETIELIADKFNENKLGDTFNFMHSNKKVEAYLIENWLTGKTDKSKDYGYDLPKGTWFGKVKVKNEKFWNEEVKTEKLKGFSVEIKSDIELVHLNNNNKQYNTNLMEIKTNEGVTLYFDGELAEGTVVFVDAEMTQFAPEGAHMLEDKRVITVDAEGKVVAIAEETPEVEVEVESEMSTEEVVVTEETATEEKLAVTAEEIMVVVQPIFDQFTNTIAELTNKIAELESKMAEENKVEAEMTELKSQVEKLSKSPSVESISKKDDVRLKRENDLLSKISMFRISTK